MTSPAEEGDITVRPVPGSATTVEVALTAAFAARVCFPASGIRDFVAAVRDRAPLDRAHITRCLDAELARITDADLTAVGSAPPATVEQKQRGQWRAVGRTHGPVRARRAGTGWNSKVEGCDE
ncbi:hypothetical protein V2S66_19110 [Streptomyces sp. V4-01]|uniref:DUF222 domain-containing protein n=1 Tax=Actinacidiphila polyblastidii TaxID=3110430 RepID=A0ABU7PE39_9ACTN|nr:hypothetical protein [Streptomyces sp. V4-01]